jgi:hypothetical protein
MKYPRIPHLPASHATSDDDIFTSENIFGREWIITEKVDGSQLSIQFIDDAPDARNRNTDILHGGADRQYHPFQAWLQGHYDVLWTMLGNGWILFGEWMFHVHTTTYTELPDLFLAFDIYDKVDEKFLPFETAMQLVDDAGLFHVPVLGKLVNDGIDRVLSFIGKSTHGDGEMEGIVLHSPDGQHRVKYVTGNFVKSISDSKAHWRWKPDRKRNAVKP